MREFTKSLLSFSWAMSLFPVQQMVNILTPQERNQQTHPATDAFNNVSKAMEEELGNVVSATFKAGDNLQKGLVDMTFSILTLQGFNPGRWMRMTSEAVEQSAEATQRGVRMASDVMQQSAEAVREGTQGGRPGRGRQGERSGGAPSGWGPVR